MPIHPKPSDALLVVDVQNDFCPGGALAVPEGDRVIPVINQLLSAFFVKVFTRDWHPANHISFSSQPKFQDLSWPPHCVQNTWGAQFHPALHSALADRIVDKGDQPDREAYSGFQDTDLSLWLKDRDIERVFVTGLATEYCVKATALDAVRSGFRTVLVTDAIGAINVPFGSGQAALDFLGTAGVLLTTSQDLVLA